MTKKKQEEVVTTHTKIKSNGLSSDYYKIFIPKDHIVESPCGQFYVVETEDIIEFALDNDFDKANLVKSCVRMGKKEGNDDQYELNKMSYSLKKLRRRFLGEEKNSPN